MIKPLPNLDQVYQIVLQEEKQRSLFASVSINGNSAAFHSYTSASFSKRLTIKGHQGSLLFLTLELSLTCSPILGII